MTEPLPPRDAARSGATPPPDGLRDGDCMETCPLNEAGHLNADHDYRPFRAALAASESSAPAEGLDAERLYQAILGELAVLWGEPSDVARSIVDRYARLTTAAHADREAAPDHHARRP